MRFLFWFCICCFVPFWFFAHALPSDKEKIYVVGVYDNPPKVFWDKTKGPNGFFVDLVDDLGMALGFKPVYVYDTWSNHLKNIQEGNLA